MWEIGRINACGKKYAPLRWELKTHVGNNRLYYIHSGVGGYVHGKKHFEFSSGTLYYIPYTADFTPWTHEEEPILHTYADFELLPPILTNEILSCKLEGRVAQAALATFEAIATACTQRDLLLREMTPNDSNRRLLCSSLLYLTELVANANESLILSDEIVSEVLMILHTRMRTPITVAEIAKNCHMNEDALIRRFTKIMKTTPYAYLKSLRLRHARLLRDTGLGWSEIANEVGYTDAASLLHALSEFKP